MVFSPNDDFDWRISTSVRPASPIIEQVVVMVHSSITLVKDWDTLAHKEFSPNSLVSHPVSLIDQFIGNVHLQKQRLNTLDVSKLCPNCDKVELPDTRIMCTSGEIAQTLAPLWFPHETLCSLMIAAVCEAKNTTVNLSTVVLATLGIDKRGIDNMSLKNANSTMRVKLVEFAKVHQQQTFLPIDGDFTLVL
jgi:hypothetical protein